MKAIKNPIYIIIFLGFLAPTTLYLGLPGGGKIGISLFLCVILLIITKTGKLKKESLHLKYLMLGIFFISIQGLLLFAKFSSTLAFLQAAFFLFIMYGFLSLKDRNQTKFANTTITECAKASLLITFTICIAQYIEYHILGSRELLELISKTQINDNFYILNQLDSGKFRSIGTYYEPSYLAMMSIFFWVLINTTHPLKTLKYDFLLLGICYTSNSLSFTLGGVIMLTLKHLVLSHRSKTNFTILFYIAPTLIIIGFFTSIAPINFDRINELQIEGSSGFYRVIAPLHIISWVLFERIIPLPLGSLSEYFYSFGLSDEIGKSFDNGYYILIAYLSWAGLALVITTSILTIRKALSQLTQKDSRALVLTYLLMLPLFNGLIFSPEFTLILIYLLKAYRDRPNGRQITFNSHG
ncbi:putative colanic acid polymerase WcaD [compost metagenome]